jgi:hypothetical protein
MKMRYLKKLLKKGQYFRQALFCDFLAVFCGKKVAFCRLVA